MSNPLGDLISGGEGAYNSFNRGRAGDAHGATIDFSKMTLADVQAAQHLDRHDPNRLFAVGKYQIIPGTMDNAVQHLHLDPNQKFTPELQERIFADYLIAEKRPAIATYIRGDASAILHGAQKAAAMEWASVDDPDTPGTPYKAYAGVGNNHSSIRASQIADALNTMRAEYQKDIAKGMKPDEAWNAVTHSTASREQAAPTHAAHDHPALHRGTHGQAVHALQADLAKLGYTDHHGKPLAADGTFGIDTRYAVERFQHDHHLTVDGKVGPLTQQALHEALRKHTTTHDLTNPRNPDHVLFEQALAGVRTLNTHGHPTEQQQRNLAAALIVEAKREGFTRIDQVALSDDGGRVYMTQHPASLLEAVKLSSVETVAALETSMEQSMAAAAAMPPPTTTPSAPILQPSQPTQALTLVTTTLHR